jgi:hypothetical protein
MKTITLLPPRRRSLGAVALLGISFGASVVLAGCSGGDQPPSNLGNTGDDLQLEPPATPAATLEDFNGHWIGEAEDPLAITTNGEPGVYRFPSGSSTIRLDLIPGEVGTLSFGDATPPAPPTNFDVGYPEGVNYLSDALFTATVLPPVEGFAYTVSTLSGSATLPVNQLLVEELLEDGVARLSYYQNEVFQEWCAGQVPSGGVGGDNNELCLPTVEGSNGGYGFGAETGDDPHCVLSDGSDIDAPSTEVDCNQAYLCGISQAPVCTCNGYQCSTNGAIQPGLFLRRVGDELIGTFAKAAFYAESGQLTSVGTVRFHRAE